MEARRLARAMLAASALMWAPAVLAPADASAESRVAPRPAKSSLHAAPSPARRGAPRRWSWEQAKKVSTALSKAANVLERRIGSLSRLGTKGQQTGMKLARDVARMLEQAAARGAPPWVVAVNVSKAVGRLAGTSTVIAKKPPAKKPTVVAKKPIVVARRPPTPPKPLPVTRPVPVKKGISVAALSARRTAKLVDYRPLILASTNESTLLDRRWRGVPMALLRPPPRIVAAKEESRPRPAVSQPPPTRTVQQRGVALAQLTAEKKTTLATALIRPQPVDIALLDRRWQGLSSAAVAAVTARPEVPEPIAGEPAPTGTPGAPTTPATITLKAQQGQSLSDLEKLAAATRASDAEAKKSAPVLAAHAQDVALMDRRWSPNAIPKIALLALPPPATEKKIARAEETKPTAPAPIPPTVPVQTSSLPLTAVAGALGKKVTVAAKWWADVPEDIRLLDLRWSKRGAGRLVAAVGPSEAEAPSKSPSAADVAGPLAGVVPLHLLQPPKIDLAPRSALSVEEKQLLAGALPRGQAIALADDKPAEKSDPRKVAELLRTEVARPVAAAPAAPPVANPTRKAASALEALAGKGASQVSAAGTKAKTTEERALLQAASGQ